MAQIVLFDELPIRVDAQGAWLHGDQPLHPRVATLFSRHVVPHADGSYWIELGLAKHVVEVADTPFHARTVLLTQAADQTLCSASLVVSDGITEPLDFASLMQAADGAFFCRIKRHGWRVPCKIKPADYHALALHAEAQGDAVCLVAAGNSYCINSYDGHVRPV